MTSKRSETMRARWADPACRQRMADRHTRLRATAEFRSTATAGIRAAAKTRKPKQEAKREEKEMIVVTHGTTYITAEAFQDRLYHLGEGKPFTYATGDLASACLVEKDARDLRGLVQTLADQKKIALTQRRRPDLKMKNGLAAFEYIATKRAAIEQALNPRKSRDQTEKQPA